MDDDGYRGDLLAGPRLARLQLDDKGNAGISFTWQKKAGLLVTRVFEEPAQLVQVGDLLVVVGSHDMAGIATEAAATSGFFGECASAMAEGKQFVSCTFMAKAELALREGEMQPGVVDDAPPLPLGASWQESSSPPPPDLEANGEERQVRLHRVWEGGNRFCCKGFLMTGNPGHTCTLSGCLRGGESEPGSGRLESSARCVAGYDALDRPLCTASGPANIFAWVCILVPSGLYLGMAFPYYWAVVHPILPLFAMFFFLLTVGCLLGACLADPGIIPRREVILATGSAERISEELGYDVLGKFSDECGTDGTPRVTIPPELRAQGYRWCSTCQIVRPPRASHCADCDCCVLRFDHHCPFINNCVGQRNYLFFFGFTSSVCCLAILVIPSLIWFAALSLGMAPMTQDKDKISFKDVPSDGVMQGVLITVGVAGGGTALFVLALWAYHVFLICSGLTTKEHLKGRKSQDYLPGLGDDLTICGRRGPSLFNPRALVKAVRTRAGMDRPAGRWRLKEADAKHCEA